MKFPLRVQGLRSDRSTGYRKTAEPARISTGQTPDTKRSRKRTFIPDRTGHFGHIRQNTVTVFCANPMYPAPPGTHDDHSVLRKRNGIRRSFQNGIVRQKKFLRKKPQKMSRRTIRETAPYQHLFPQTRLFRSKQILTVQARQPQRSSSAFRNDNQFVRRCPDAVRPGVIPVPDLLNSDILPFRRSRIAHRFHTPACLFPENLFQPLRSSRMKHGISDCGPTAMTCSSARCFRPDFKMADSGQIKPDRKGRIAKRTAFPEYLSEIRKKLKRHLRNRITRLYRIFRMIGRFHTNFRGKGIGASVQLINIAERRMPANSVRKSGSADEDRPSGKIRFTSGSPVPFQVQNARETVAGSSVRETSAAESRQPPATLRASRTDFIVPPV